VQRRLRSLKDRAIFDFLDSTGVTIADEPKAEVV
jgi:hypothetical protein